MTAQTYNITSADMKSAPDSNNNVTPVLILQIQPQATQVNGATIQSPYTATFQIAAPSAAQMARYIPTTGTPVPTITLSSDV